MYGLNDVISTYVTDVDEMKKAFRKILTKSKVNKGDTKSTLELKLNYIEEICDNMLIKE